jgi:dTDP-4-dehydrorhamnose 3,5-epimerase-like enzyme
VAHILTLRTFPDGRGKLTVIEKEIGFPIKRVFYIYDTSPDVVRGGHAHRTTLHAVICIQGTCEVFVDNGVEEKTFVLDSSDKCLILNPEDWHTMSKFSPGCVLLTLASDYYDPDEYVLERHT